MCVWLFRWGLKPLQNIRDLRWAHSSVEYDKEVAWAVVAPTHPCPPCFCPQMHTSLHEPKLPGAGQQDWIRISQEGSYGSHSAEKNAWTNVSLVTLIVYSLDYQRNAFALSFLGETGLWESLEQNHFRFGGIIQTFWWEKPGFWADGLLRLSQRRGGFNPEDLEQCLCFTASCPKAYAGAQGTIIMSWSQAAADQAGCQDQGSRPRVWATMSQRPGRQSTLEFINPRQLDQMGSLEIKRVLSTHKSQSHWQSKEESNR